MYMRMQTSASGPEESPQHSEELRVGFVEALSTSHDIDRGVETGTNTSSPGKFVDASLTDSDAENMKPCFSD